MQIGLHLVWKITFSGLFAMQQFLYFVHFYHISLWLLILNASCFLDLMQSFASVAFTLQIYEKRKIIENDEYTSVLPLYFHNIPMII